MSFENPHGKLGVLNADGPIDTAGHPFFEPLGTNGRACVTCHQPAFGMSVSVAGLRERWKTTKGEDPVFAAVDGSNHPKLPQERESSHSLLLNRGLFRIALPWPPRTADGSEVKPEFTIEVVRDPTGCNTDSEIGLKSERPTISVFRRPRPVANLKYVTTGGARFNIKTGLLMDVDPETGRPVSMNLLSDARFPTLKLQAQDAAWTHEGLEDSLTGEQLQKILQFERQVYAAQSHDLWGGSLIEQGGPAGLGPLAMLRGRAGTLGDIADNPVFLSFDAWKRGDPSGANGSKEEAFRASVARGSDVFMFRQFWIRDAVHINTIGLGNPIKRTCATCHNSQMTGMDLAPGWVDLGTNNYPTWTEPLTWTAESELPVFKLTVHEGAPPHPFLGRVIYTTDPGRALITGKSADIGSIVMQQMRGLAARAPYFANGSAKSLRELVDYYDRRFDIKYTEQEKQDLINFLSVL
jgi:cytochrome c peroxidase